MNEILDARLVVHDAKSLTARQKKAISEWLQRQAEQLLAEGDRYAKRFTASYRRTQA